MSKPAAILTPHGPNWDIVDVTPELAEKWLAKNPRNRNVRRQVVARYARDMTAGRWRLNGDAIRFDAHGALLDGQHRLHAVVESGVTITTFVIRGLDPAAQETMDDGARRAPADFINMRGQHSAAAVAAVARKMLQWESGRPGARSFRGYQPSTTEILEAFEGDKAVTRAAEVADKYRRLIPVNLSVIGLCWWLFSSINYDQACDFYDRLATGANLTAGHPILTLRNRLIALRNERHVRVMEEQYAAMFIRTWNAVRDGRSLSKIYAFGRNGDEFPEPK